MLTDDKKVKDPVCHMWVLPDQYAIKYQGLDFAFCSQQCRDRFLANPHLYIGKPGRVAPKQAGHESIKRRTLTLTEPLSQDMSDELISGLRDMMGIKDVVVTQDKVDISYDLLQATAEQIEDKIAEVGAGLGQGWADRLRRAFVHYLEETEIDNLEEGSSSHGHHH